MMLLLNHIILFSGAQVSVSTSWFDKGLHEVETMGQISKWILGFDVFKNQNCYILNFGWSLEISIPMFLFNENVDIDTVYTETMRVSSPSNCFIVLIGGKFSSKVDEIISKVEFMSSELRRRVLLYFTESTIQFTTQNLMLVSNFQMIALMYNFSLIKGRNSKTKQ